MWNIFRRQQQTAAQGHSQEDLQQASDLKTKFDDKLRSLSKEVKLSEQQFLTLYSSSPHQEMLASTFADVMASLEGLVSLIEQLRKEYEQSHDQQVELERCKTMLANHHNIVNDIQDTHSQELHRVIDDKQKQAAELNRQIQALREENQILGKKLNQAELIIQRQQESIIDLQNARTDQEEQLRKVDREKEEAIARYVRSVEGATIDNRKTINFDSIKLEYVFYYQRIRQTVLSFLPVPDLLALQLTSKHYKHSIDKDQAKHICLSLRATLRRRENEAMRQAKAYERIYELFPSQNIKMNALKYLYFKIKPAHYILPLLQQDHEPQPEQNQPKGRFNWRGLFSNEKTKKEQNKFSISQLKNEEEYKKVQAKIEATFRNVLSVKLPEDLQYFSQTMQRQLQELKDVLTPSKSQSRSQAEWTAQLHCLSKFMYLQTNELHNLLQVIFGQLVLRSRQLQQLQENYDYLQGNEVILRNLIEDISRQRADLHHRHALLQNEQLKQTLSREAEQNHHELMAAELAAVRGKCEGQGVELLQLRRTVEKYQEERKHLESSFHRIREELDNLQTKGKVRKDSCASEEWSGGRQQKE